MEIKLISSTESMKSLEDMVDYCVKCARVCYSSKSWGEIEKESSNESLKQRLIDSGHHSVFEHVNFGFSLEDVPKAFAMLLNNEKQYATSEKSARYTQMEGMPREQKELYDKWNEILIPKIDKVYPRKVGDENREQKIKKLAQENARYMTSVFTPTKMIHTINLRQLNYLQQKFEDIIENESYGEDEFKNRLSCDVEDFLKQTNYLRIPGLDNQTGRELTLLRKENLKPVDYYGYVYARSYLISFAGLGQSHRHRTVNYNILGGTDLGAPTGFFVPDIVDYVELTEEWTKDLNLMSESDFPQAQLLEVYERGLLEDFHSKIKLRICGHAQLEIMKITSDTAGKYNLFQEVYGKKILQPKCTRGEPCASPCDWGGERATNRLV